MPNITPRQTLLALCSAAILTTATFMAVESASSTPAQAQSAIAHSTSAKTVHRTTRTTRKVTHVTKTTKTVKHVQKYKDGTYSGVGETQIGAVQVAVTLRRDKITRVEITQSSTHYPISYIDPILPQELLARQDINKIDVISGATLSTEDFYFAVVTALKEARQAELKLLTAKSHA